MYDTVIFDFDGTIVDSEQLMLDALNAVSNEFGFPHLSRDEIPQLRKMSARELVSRRLHIPLWRVWKLRRLEKRTKKEFAKHGGTLRVFPHMAEIISELRLNGYRVGIVSSAVASLVERVLRDADITVDFLHAGSAAYRKAHALKATLAAHGLDKHRTVYVGDELRDVDACRRVGIPIIAVGWGLNDAASLAEAGAKVASTPAQLFSMITANT